MAGSASRPQKITTVMLQKNNKVQDKALSVFIDVFCLFSNNAMVQFVQKRWNMVSLCALDMYASFQGFTESWTWWLNGSMAIKYFFFQVKKWDNSSTLMSTRMANQVTTGRSLVLDGESTGVAGTTPIA